MANEDRQIVSRKITKENLAKNMVIWDTKSLKHHSLSPKHFGIFHNRWEDEFIKVIIEKFFPNGCLIDVLNPHWIEENINRTGQWKFSK